MNTKIEVRDLITWGIVLIAIVIAFFILTDKSEDKVIKTEVKKEVAVSQETLDKETIRSFFNVGCMEENASYAECNCMFNAIYDKIGGEEFMNESIRFNATGEFSDSFINEIAPAVFKCVK